MEKNEIVKECKPPVMLDILQENRKLINEELMIANELYTLITSDVMATNTENEPTCVMSDIVMQNQDLHTLLDLLIKIKGQIK